MRSIEAKTLFHFKYCLKPPATASLQTVVWEFYAALEKNFKPFKLTTQRE